MSETSTTPETAKKVLVIAGASGVVGRHLIEEARREGWQVRALTRGGAPLGAEARTWDPVAAARGDDGALASIAAALEGARAVVNLAGASLGEGRLGDAHQERVLSSRVDATRALVRARARCAAPPPTWLQASAVGFYGDTGEARVPESAPRGRSFLADVCVAWEATAREALVHAPPPRLVLLRLGLVLAPDAPAWEKMLLPIRLGLGGPLGSGRQWWAWIEARDAARAILHLERTAAAEGPVNLVSPASVRQGDLAREAAVLLGRPALLPAPAFALRLAAGKVADELLLPSCDAQADKLLGLGFRFDCPSIDRFLARAIPA